MYKCLNCGNIFDDGEQGVIRERHTIDDSANFEEFYVCPLCCSDEFEKTAPCRQCRGEFLEDELYDGLCKECLTEAVTYDTALEFLETKPLTVTDFIFEKIFKMPPPKQPSVELEMAMDEYYRREVANEKLLKKTEFIELIRSYILDGDGYFGKFEFAMFINQKRKKENHE